MQRTIIFFLFSLTFVKSAIVAQSVIAANQLNIIYIGVPNTMRFAAAGIPSNELEVSTSEGTIQKGASGNIFILNPTTPGQAKLTVSHKGKVIGNHLFSVKRIPDPYVQLPLNNRTFNRGGTIPAATFRTIPLLTVEMEGYELENPCVIQSFDITHVRKGSDPVQLNNSSGHFSVKVLELVKRVTAGDVVYFDNIKGRCPGDTVGRETNALYFKIN